MFVPIAFLRGFPPSLQGGNRCIFLRSFGSSHSLFLRDPRQGATQVEVLSLWIFFMLPFPFPLDTWMKPFPFFPHQGDLRSFLLLPWTCDYLRIPLKQVSSSLSDTFCPAVFTSFNRVLCYLSTRRSSFFFFSFPCFSELDFLAGAAVVRNFCHGDG